MNDLIADNKQVLIILGRKNKHYIYGKAPPPINELYSSALIIMEAQSIEFEIAT